MTEEYLIYSFYITLLLLVINVVLVITKKQKLTRLVGIFILLSSLFSYIGSYLVSGHLPVYDKFTTLPNISFIAIFLSLLYNRTPEIKQKNINIAWPIIFILYALVFLYKMEISSYYYMYDKFYVMLFFQLRITAIGIFVFAIINSISAILDNTNSGNALNQRARNYTILGAVVFLCGEFSGSYWCFLWWGDSWHWTKGFFFASIMFLLSMVGSHLPKKYRKTPKQRAILNTIALGLIIVSYLLPH